MAKGTRRMAYDNKQTAGLRKTIRALDKALGALPAAHEKAVRGHLEKLSQQHADLLGFDHQSKDIHWLACWSAEGDEDDDQKVAAPVKPRKLAK